ncbi:hypothetical protein F5H01DRAFT_383940 [Linnemannia elongata]|nr:hypothetical protein F5H01DRAFT_383940 [Linnemannia elongata]
MSQTSSREQQQQQQQQHQQQQERHSQSRTRTRSIGETETTTGPSATKKKRTKSATSTIASSSSRNSTPIPPSRAPSTLSLASSFLDPSLPHHEPVEHALAPNNNDAIEGTSLLGSVWNLFRDVKDLASKEIDKLLEHFPYKNNAARVIVTTNQDDLQDRLLSAKKRQGVLVASLSTASLPRKSLLGHGPSQKRRTGTPQGNQAVLTKRLLDQDLRTQVNDVSSRRIPASTASVMSGVSTESRRMLSVRSGSASTISDTGSRQSTTRRKQTLATPRPTPTPPLLKRDSSISASLYRSSQDTEADWSSAVSHLDEVESESSEPRTCARSRESSATPPITTMARAMSISERNQSSQRFRQTEQPGGSDIRKRIIGQSSAQLSRHSSSQSESDLANGTPKQQQQPTRKRRENGPETALYPQSSTNSRNRTSTENGVPTKVVDSPPSAFTDSKNNPFIASSGRSSPTHDTRTPSPTTNVDNATLSALIEQVSTMREQLASLMAEKQGLYRTHSAPASIGPGIPPPPPPPPFPGTPSSKLRTPPVNEATRSMQRVLNELSTSKVQLRKTGSPFLSRISSAIDSSPNSKFSRVVFKSRMDMASDKYTGSSIAGSTAPLSLVSRLRGPSTGTNLEETILQSVEKAPAETPMKRRVRPIYQEPEEEEEGRELIWPSPRTVRRADSRLEMAAKDLTRNKSNREQAATLSQSSDGLTTRSAEDQTSKKEGRLGPTAPTPKSHHLLESKRKWAPRISQPSGTEPREIVQTTSSAIAGAAELSLDGGGSLMDDGSGVFGRERTGPRLDDNSKRPRRPSRPRSMVLSRSMTDPTTLHSAPTMTTAEKEKERQWFLESDMESWKVAQ